MSVPERADRNNKPWTPTEEVIRDAVTFERDRLGEPRPIKPDAFDRFIAGLRAETLRDWADGTAAALIERGAELDPRVYEGLSMSVESARYTATRLEQETP